MQLTIGVDISKDHLDVCRWPDGAARRFSNDRRGHRALLAWLGEAEVARVVRVVYEPTGPYHRGLERALAAAGLPLAKVNPRQARRFAEATGKLAKTDRTDAATLARMGALLEPEPRPVASALLEQLGELHRARRALVKDRTAARNRQKVLSLPLLKRQNTARLKQIESQLAAIDRELEALIASEPELARRFDILRTIPGISNLAAFALLIDMPELGTLDQRQVASLAGLAPVTRQSGTWSGRASIRGGRAQLRQALYMPALVAARFNPELKAKYDQLIAAGKPPKVAITAVMRKLLILANALLRDRREWSPNLP